MCDGRLRCLLGRPYRISTFGGLSPRARFTDGNGCLLQHTFVESHNPPVKPDKLATLLRLFEEAMALPDNQRLEFLAKACEGDSSLEREVQELLQAAVGTSTDLTPTADVQLTSPTQCPSCSAPIVALDRFCRRCGTPVTATRLDEGPFRPGSLFADRFRMIGELGRGGMGAVYRAHDLKLDQTVALKFLQTKRLQDHGSSHLRLRAEVRLARQIAHPNVCRVYDLGEYGGHVYISMEYVDGEDLAVLLQRIGRLPLDKGIEVARKLCAGLAAAHAKGVLHRDLKPRNIMIDSHGGVRIMDFGIAVVADRLDPADIGSGTPAYMAPEQLAGREVTRQSDLYALGLVLFELFTGRPPFQAKSVHDLLRLREAFDFTKPSLITEGLSATIDRAILWCLEPNPQRRPQSALEVAAALPSSGDPLAEALAAGETPSPATVAASGAREALRPQSGIALLTCIAASLTAVCFLTPHIQLVGRVPLEHPPQVLAAKARDIAQSLGFNQPPRDFDSGFAYDERQIQYLRRTISGGAAEKKTTVGSDALPRTISSVVLVPTELNPPRSATNRPLVMELIRSGRVRTLC